MITGYRVQHVGPSKGLGKSLAWGMPVAFEVTLGAVSARRNHVIPGCTGVA